MKRLIVLLLLIPHFANAGEIYYRSNGDTSVTLGPICVPEAAGVNLFDVDFNTTNLTITIYARGNGVASSFVYTGGNIDDYDGVSPAWGNPVANAIEVEDVDECVTLHIRDEVFAVANATEWTVKFTDSTTDAIMDWTAQILDGEKPANDAIVAYDPPTNTEFEARSVLSGNYFDPATDTVATVTNVSNAITLPTMPANWITALGITNGAFDGKGDWNIGKTGYALTQTFPTNFSSMAIDVSGNVSIDSLPTMPANWVTALGVTNGALNGKGDWNIGKTGYALTQTFPANFSSMAISGTGVVNSNNVEWIGVAIATALSQPADIATAVRDVVVDDQGSVTLACAVAAILARQAGDWSGTTNVVYQDATGTETRVTVNLATANQRDGTITCPTL